VLHAFSGGSDGGNPYGGVFVDSSGNAYGTTAGGGASDSGVIFKLDANSAEAVLYNFCSLQNCTDGAFPQAAPIMDGDGNLYGTTQTGGVKCRAIKGCGTVYRLTPSGSETVLHAFTDSEGDGSYPESGLVMNRKGDLFGVTGWGGNDMCGGGCGIVFKVSPGGKETILHTFTGQEDGFHSLGSLVSDKAGNLYAIPTATPEAAEQFSRSRLMEQKPCSILSTGRRLMERIQHRRSHWISLATFME
jgi:uncharacterized repeat protein (TIGR03803 family)